MSYSTYKRLACSDSAGRQVFLWVFVISQNKAIFALSILEKPQATVLEALQGAMISLKQ